jgi:hypothetical protein
MTYHDIEIPKEKIAEFCRKWKIVEFSLFGSILREDFGPGSDVDVLVKFAENPGWGLYDLVEMEEELKTLFGRKVDLVMKGALHNPFRRHSILTSREVIYAAG